MAFKQGDLVLCIDDVMAYGLKANMIYEVNSFHHRLPLLYLYNFRQGFHPIRFVKLNPCKLTKLIYNL